jgi:hypothetical protein
MVIYVCGKIKIGGSIGRLINRIIRAKPIVNLCPKKLHIGLKKLINVKYEIVGRRNNKEELSIVISNLFIR